MPRNKGKNTDDSITDANYLWVSLFATSLNENGRAGFVMPNSASDAGNSEYDIRKKLVDSNMVDCMVSMPSNMFFTVTLPATLWFLDKQKVNTGRKDKILFLDARNTYTQIDRAHREWKEEQIQNLSAIVRLYRGETDRYLELVSHYAKQANEAILEIPAVFDALQNKLNASLANFKQYVTDSKIKRKPEEKLKLDESGLVQKLKALVLPNLLLPTFESRPLSSVQGQTNKEQLAFDGQLATYLSALKELDAILKTNKDTVCEIWAEADKILKLKTDKTWAELELNNLAKVLDELQQKWKTATEQVNYWYTNMYWLQSRFPDAKYTDVVGLCKEADKKEYAEEQDYSLNAGRYVGVELDDESITIEEFKYLIESKYFEFKKLTERTTQLEASIGQNLKSLL